MVEIFSPTLINKLIGVPSSEPLLPSLRNHDGNTEKWLALYRALQTQSHLKDYNTEMS